MRRRLLLAAVVVLAAAGCSDGGADTAGPDTAALAPAQTTVAPAPSPSGAGTTAPPPAPSTEAPPQAGPTRYFETHEEAAGALFDAWQAGDRAAAAEVAPPEAVEAAFAIPPEGFYEFGCDTGEFDSGTCNYRTDTLYAKFIAESTEPGWQVTRVIVSDDA